MMILVFDKYLGYQIGGAQKSLHFLLENLDADFQFVGCDVKKSFSAERYILGDWQAQRIAIKELPKFPYIEYWLNRKKIKDFISASDADLLITQGLWGSIAARFFKGKTIYFIRDEYHFNKIPIYQIGVKKFFKKIYIFLQWPFIKLIFKDNKRAIEKADIVIANSRFVANKIKEIFNKEAEVVYPMIDVVGLSKDIAPSFDDREFIVSIGSETIKGRGIVEKIASAMSKHKFMIVGRDFSQSIQKNNILYYPWDKDSIRIYEKARIILVPSIWEEAFGRVAVEGMALGIPVVGSKRGGISEVLNDDFLIENIWNTEAWKNKILEIEKEPNKFLEINRKKALGFDAILQIDKFKKIVKDKTGVNL